MICPDCGQLIDDWEPHVCYADRESPAPDGRVVLTPLEDRDVLGGPIVEI